MSRRDPLSWARAPKPERRSSKGLTLVLVGSVAAALGLGYFLCRPRDDAVASTQPGHRSHHAHHYWWSRPFFGGGTSVASGTDSGESHSGTAARRGGFGSTGRSFSSGG